MNIFIGDINSYPNTDYAMTYDNTESISKWYTQKMDELSVNLKSLPTVLDEAIEILNRADPTAAKVSELKGAGFKAIAAELKRTNALYAQTPPLQRYWDFEPLSENDISIWRVRIFHPASTDLAKVFKQYGIDYILLEVRFWDDYPNSPPFVRVVSPRFLAFNNGGGKFLL